MPTGNQVKPYLVRIKNWKIRNMVMLYLEAREKFKTYRRLIRDEPNISFEGMKEICDILYEIKEEHHLIFKRIINPKKNKFEKAKKFMPDQVETDFMNNIGLLFHKLMVARELKYSMEHYVEASETFKRSKEDLQFQLKRIDALFDEGIEILKNLIGQYKDNMLLLTLLLEDPNRTKKHFGKNAVEILEQFVDGQGLDEVYYSVGRFYAYCGWQDKARDMFKEALKRNPKHKNAQQDLSNLS